jgi:erythritol kinase
MASCAGDWVTPLLSDAESPDPVLSDIYAEAYPAFAEAHEVLRPVWKKLAERKIM